MNDRPPFDETVDHSFAGASILPALAANLPHVPRVQLREPLTEGVTPVNLPGSSEMPEVESPPRGSQRLQLLGEIARGGMGTILKGRDVDLGRDLAVKVLREEHRGKSEMAQRFIEEAQINGQLQHPGIAPVHELGMFPDGRPYFTMKLVKGQTLAALLAARKEALEDRPRFLGIFAQVCQTLAYAHARGVIHRDVKPSNVMVGAFGEVQVMDWGLAKVLKEGGIADELRSRQRDRAENVSVIRTARSQEAGTPEVGSQTQAGTLLGTPAYMAPEQARGDVEQVDERADVFGLGAVLCEILTGKPPYTGKGTEVQYKARAAKLEEAFTQLEACGADVELIDLAKRCLAAEPWDRPRHAGEVAEQVTAYQHAVTERLRQAEVARAAEEARAIEARATAAQERKARRMTLALAATVLLAMLVGGGGWLWLQGQRAAQRAEHNQAVNDALSQAIRLRLQARTAKGAAARELEGQARDQAQRAKALVESGSADADLAARVRELAAEWDEEAKNRKLAEEHGRLGLKLWQDGKADEALVEYRKAAELDPTKDSFHQILGTLLLNKDRLDEAIAAYRKALEIDPSPATIHNNLGVALSHKGRVDEAIAEYNKAIEQNPRDSIYHNNLGRALLDRGRLDEAIAAHRKGVEIEPRNAAARDYLVRLEKVAALQSKLPAYREGKYSPRDNAERLLLAQLCGVKKFHHAAARLYAEVFVAEPGLADNRVLANNRAAAYRYDAACSAALAGFGQGEDAKTLGDGQRARWRQQALDWLRADLMRWEQEMETAKLWVPDAVRNELKKWQRDKDLAVVRGEETLAPLPAEERRRWQTLWADVAKHLGETEGMERRIRAVEKEFPALMSGQAKPADVWDLMTAARIATHRHRQFAAATRLLEQSLAANPTWAGQLPADPPCYYAACCAAMAAAGEGSGAATLDAAARRRLRRRAVAWLREELDRKQGTAGTAADRTTAPASLAYWKEDGWLSSLRDAGALAKLPDDERQACEKLWADVDALLEKTRNKK
jgi:Flp pilus assembly protein TadD/tRNA A-37 threonylcarbamoyl transferase component Bud32